MRLFVGSRSAGGGSTLAAAEAVALVVACASRTGIAPPSSVSDAITKAEITRSRAINAYDAIQILRPSMLRERGQVTILGNDVREPMVYLDNQRIGGISYLRDIPISEIFEIRYHTAAQAQIQWGSGHMQGVIQVVTARATP